MPRPHMMDMPFARDDSLSGGVCVCVWGVPSSLRHLTGLLPLSAAERAHDGLAGAVSAVQPWAGRLSGNAPSPGWCHSVLRQPCL